MYKFIEPQIESMKKLASHGWFVSIVERIDAMETTLAHIVPEFTANILLPAVMFIYLLTLDWRLGLGNLVGAAIGLVFCTVMMIKSRGGYEVSVQKTKKLNDTAVEYINGIEVIKAFGKTGSSYEKFVVAAREGADCFIYKNFITGRKQAVSWKIA